MRNGERPVIPDCAWSRLLKPPLRSLVIAADKIAQFTQD